MNRSSMDMATESVWDEDRLISPHDRDGKANRVRRTFNAIAPTYERINRWFSAGRDAYWRRRAVELAEVGPADTVLDIACGSGDLARAMALRKPRHVLGCDFAHDMLRLACGRGSEGIAYCEGDALALPLPDASVTVTGCAFGVRNFGDAQVGLSEMHRVLSPGGRAVILEFTRPAGRLMRVVYEWYSGRVMPVLATVLARDHTGAYRYLPRSVVCFADADQMCRMLSAAGFVEVQATPLTHGVVTIYVARKAPHG